MSEAPNEERLAGELEAVITTLDESKVAMTCAREAHDSRDFRTMSEDLWRAAASAERLAMHYRGAAALAKLISEGRP